jgi:hypothetical protein
VGVDPQIVGLLVVTGVGWLMLQAGLGKHMLEWRRRQRTCPSCGRAIAGRTCGCHGG